MLGKSLAAQAAGYALLCCLLFSCKKETVIEADPVLPPPAPSAVVKDSVYTVLSEVKTKITNRIGGYYLGLPSNYDKTSQSYPLLLYMHGAGQIGNGTSDLWMLLKDGVAKVIHEKKFPGSFRVNGKAHSFIVLVPQVNNFPGAGDVKASIEWAKKNWRVDASRIYLSGLSAGSMASCDLAAENSSKIAALVPMAGVSPDYASTNKCQKIAQGKLPVWVFHSQDDPQVPVSQAKEYVARIRANNPAIPPRLTVWSNGGHDAWTRAVDPSYKENGMNMYEWMLQYHR